MADSQSENLHGNKQLLASASTENNRSQPSRLTDLRQKAQEHLEQINQEVSDEMVAQEKARTEVHRYIKHRRSSRSKSPSGTASSEMRKAPSMRTAQEVLDRLRWDKSLNMSDYRVGYLDRFNGVIQMPAEAWIRESTEEYWIPQHRIKYFKKIDESGNEETIWDRDQRIDRVFGSGFVK